MSTLHRHRIELGLMLAAVFLISACSVNVKKNEKGEDKNVDIKTPFGGIHVDTSADARDTGLSVYPGARLKPNEGHDDKSANVNISSSFGGLRVVALQYVSDDSPEKVADFYRGQLKKYGNILTCHTHRHGGNVEVNHSSDKDDDDNGLKCEDSGGETLELKAGSKDNQRIVAIEPSGKGSSFALVRVQVHGKEAI